MPSDTETLTAPKQIWLASRLGKSLFLKEDGSPLLKAPEGIDLTEVLSDDYLKKARELRDKLAITDAEKIPPDANV